MDDDLDEFLDLINGQSCRFHACHNPDWLLAIDPKRQHIAKTKSLCPFVLTRDETRHAERHCHACKRAFTICDCGEGMTAYDGKERLCVLIVGGNNIQCPKLEEDDPSS